MEHLYAAADEAELKRLRAMSKPLLCTLEAYLAYLHDALDVRAAAVHRVVQRRNGDNAPEPHSRARLHQRNTHGHVPRHRGVETHLSAPA